MNGPRDGRSATAPPRQNTAASRLPRRDDQRRPTEAIAHSLPDLDHHHEGAPIMATVNSGPQSLVLVLGHRELVIRRRYEALSIINDILIAVWFTVGSFMFFSDALTYAGTWLFVIGSIELLIRPAIRLTRHVHLQRLPGRHGTPTELGHDF
jgi:YrhK-like protein